MVEIVRDKELLREDLQWGTSRKELVFAERLRNNDLRADIITYPSGASVPLHYHPDARHYWFVLEGKGVLNTEDETFEVRAGDVVIIDFPEPHGVDNPYDETFSFCELWVPAPQQPAVWVD